MKIKLARYLVRRGVEEASLKNLNLSMVSEIAKKGREAKIWVFWERLF